MTKNFSNVKDYKVVANNVVNELRKFKYNEIVVLDDGYAISVDTDDDGNKTVSLWMSANNDNFIGHETIRTIKMGKRCFGLVDKVIMLLETIDSYNEYLMETRGVDELNSADEFNEYVKQMLMDEYDRAISSANDFADAYGDTCVENEYICGTMEYDYDIKKMWVEWCWKNDVMSRDDAYKYFDDNRDEMRYYVDGMLLDVDDLDDYVRGLDGTDAVENGECLVWVKNPYYVEQEQVKNDSPCLDRVVKVIEDYVNNYEGMMMDYDGNSASICVGWDNFNEDDMKMLIENEEFEGYVVNALMGKDIKDVLVYDDGVYVSVDAKMFDNVA